MGSQLCAAATVGSMTAKDERLSGRRAGTSDVDQFDAVPAGTRGSRSNWGANATQTFEAVMSLPEFSVTRSNSGAPPRVAVRGELDLSAADRVQAVLAVPPQDGQTLVLDLAAVSFMDSTGLGL